MIESGQRRRFAIAGAFLAIVLAISITPIRSYDYFWHLATGNWILDQGKLPETDPFSVSSDETRWIDGAWLFQVGAAVVDRVGGTEATSVARGVVVALIFTIGLATLLRRVHPVMALFVASVAMWGADHRLTTRPETIATLFLVAALWILLEWKPDARGVVAYGLLTVLWMSSHPSALLAPAVGGLVLAGRFVAGERGRDLVMRGALVAVSGVALLANPWGLEGILAPLRLASLVGSGRFVNIEWTATRPIDFPLVYLVAIAIVALFVVRGEWKEQSARLLIFAFFAMLAFRFVRNHGLFFAAVPFVVSPLVGMDLKTRVRTLLALATSLLLCGLVWMHGGIRVGVDARQFPVASASYLKKLGLEGNIYNPDQLGGYLIWTFYPERRVVTDGRNELHVTYIEEYAKARLDQLAWNALIDKYEITLAVDEYHRESMDVVDAVTGERRKLPVSLIYFPRARWALIGFDDVAMVFARRDAFEAEVIEELELRTLVPDGAIPIVDTSPETMARARAEVVRARELFGRHESIERIAAMLGVR